VKQYPTEHRASARTEAAKVRVNRFLQRFLERQAKTKAHQFAVDVVQTAMKNGLEWAVKNPRPFLQDSGAVVDGSDLTDEEQSAVVEVLQKLLDRLVTYKRPLWEPNRVGKRGPSKKTIERRAEEAGARRGW